MGYFSLFLIGLVDGGQLCGIVDLRPCDRAVEGLADLDAYGNSAVHAVCSDIGAIFGQQILLDVIERQVDVLSVQQTVEVFIVVGGLVPSSGSHKVVVSQQLSLGRLEESVVDGQSVEI